MESFFHSFNFKVKNDVSEYCLKLSFDSINNKGYFDRLSMLNWCQLMTLCQSSQKKSYDMNYRMISNM